MCELFQTCIFISHYSVGLSQILSIFVIPRSLNEFKQVNLVTLGTYNWIFSLFILHCFDSFRLTEVKLSKNLFLAREAVDLTEYRKTVDWLKEFHYYMVILNVELHFQPKNMLKKIKLEYIVSTFANH